MAEHVQMEFSRVTPNICLGTNLCCEDHGQQLRALGARIDISLEYENTVVPHMFETFLWLPVQDHQAPSMEQLDVGTAVLAEADAKGYGVYAHCKNGHGRAPTLVIAYFIRTGQTLAEAEATVRKKRPEIDLTAAQRERLQEYAARYNLKV